MIKPFNTEMFCNTYGSITDQLSPHEIAIIKNFEKIVHEKYIDRVYSVSSPMFVFEDETYSIMSRVVPSIEEVIAGFMETLVATDKNLFCMNYVKVLNAYNRVRFVIV